MQYLKILMNFYDMIKRLRGKRLYRSRTWQAFAEEIGANYQLSKFSVCGEIHHNLGGHNSVLDVFIDKGLTELEDLIKIPPPITRARVEYANAEGFYCEIYPSSKMNPFLKILGTQGIKIGEETLDKNYIFKGNNTEKIRFIFAQKEICKFFSQFPNIHLTINSENQPLGSFHPRGCNKVVLKIVGIINDKDKLARIFKFLENLMRHLEQCHKQTLEQQA